MTSPSVGKATGHRLQGQGCGPPSGWVRPRMRLSAASLCAVSPAFSPRARRAAALLGGRCWAGPAAPHPPARRRGAFPPPPTASSPRCLVSMVVAQSREGRMWACPTGSLYRPRLPPALQGGTLAGRWACPRSCGQLRRVSFLLQSPGRRARRVLAVRGVWAPAAGGSVLASWPVWGS